MERGPFERNKNLNIYCIRKRLASKYVKFASLRAISLKLFSSYVWKISVISM